MGLPHNTRFVGVDFVGPILIAGVDGEEFTDVPMADFLMRNLKDEEDET